MTTSDSSVRVAGFEPTGGKVGFLFSLPRLLRVRPGGDARQLLRYPAWSPPVLSRGILYLRGKGRLAAFELITTTDR